MLHLGWDDWVIVDSCVLDDDTSTPVSLAYLEELGVDPGRDVKLVVVTHWHDDHIGGMARVIRKCKKAKIGMSAAFTRRDFIKGVHVVEPASTLPRSGVREFWEVWKFLEDNKRPPTHGSVDKLLWHRHGDVPVRVVALSPSNEDVFRGVQQLREFVLDVVGGTLEYIPALTPNEASVAAWVTVGETHLLLGADLERPSNVGRGWLAILESAGEWGDKRAELFKIPHHGSAGAYEPRVWSEMLTDTPLGVVAPFRNGRHDLPDSAQRARLLGHSPLMYITSQGAPPPPLSEAAQQTISEATTFFGRLDAPTGQVRLRKPVGTPHSAWSVELFPPAAVLAA